MSKGIKQTLVEFTQECIDNIKPDSSDPMSDMQTVIDEWIEARGLDLVEIRQSALILIGTPGPVSFIMGLLIGMEMGVERGGDPRDQ